MNENQEFIVSKKCITYYATRKVNNKVKISFSSDKSSVGVMNCTKKNKKNLGLDAMQQLVVNKIIHIMWDCACLSN